MDKAKILKVGDVYTDADGEEILVSRVFEWPEEGFVDYEVINRKTGEKGTMRAKGYYIKPNKKQGATPTKQHSMKCPKLYGKKCLCDSYHTFEELYDHRIALFIALANLIYRGSAPTPLIQPWKSKLHSDGSMFDGWFVAGIGTENGKQITYHLPLKVWEELRVVVYDKAPEWDGHSPDEALKRLKLLSN